MNRRLIVRVVAFALISGLTCLSSPGADGNRFALLDEFADIYYPNHRYPKLITPQWVGEKEVEAVLVFAIDDMRDHGPYEAYLRPILERLKKIDGRAPASIMANAANPHEPHLQKWLEEGVTLETHTADHPCPILAGGNFAAAKSTYDRCVDHFFSIPNNCPVAFRTPCMDGINSVSPRLFADILMRTTEKGHFLTLSTSIGMLLTPNDPENPKEYVLDASGKPRFHKYLLPGYINYIEDYPYPYLIGNRFWEAPFTIPDDYEGFRVSGEASPATVADMKASIDAVVAKQGIWVMTFHPYAWIKNEQVVELIDHCVEKYGKRIKFLNLREVQERIDQHLLNGSRVRHKDGNENGVRLLDLNTDGFLDVIVANDQSRQTRIWDPEKKTWTSTDFPAPIVITKAGKSHSTGVRFGVFSRSGAPMALLRNESNEGLWQFNGTKWVAVSDGLKGLELNGEKCLTARNGVDRGVRLRDVDGDGISELIVSNPQQGAIFQWSGLEKGWKPMEFTWPEGVSIVTEQGLDNGVRFVDLNKDGADDLVFSNENEYGLWVAVPKAFLGFKAGWTRQVIRGKRGELPEIPMISRGGDYRNNGAWFARDHMWVQNEDTAKLPDLVQRVPYPELLNGLQPPPKPPKESLQSIVVAPEHEVELVAHEPAVQDPVFLDWGPDGTLWVVEMRDYPTGVNGQAGGVIKRLRDEDGDGFYESWSVFASGLNYPNGLIPWRDGLLVSAAPEILYLRDGDNDGKADRKEVLFTGFIEGNQQHRFNGFELGLDNWLYGANGDSGGQILSLKTQKRTSINGLDFRFNPDTGEFQPTSGQTQYGRRRDDWGNWFGGANYTWGWHYFLPEEYLARNRSLPVARSWRALNQSPEGTRVFPLSRLQQRFNDIGMAGHVTSACNYAPYRDELFGREFERSIFISEPTHNLIHREVLEPRGVSFASKRAPSETAREFLASKDPWFRPVTARTGPDGAIYFADMYRLVIEHPEWIPDDVKARMDVRAGSDMGRIYRVRPRGQPLRKMVHLDQLSGAELARAMESPNGWQRDTVQRLLLERRPLEAVAVLEELATTSSHPKVRLQALCTLDGLQPAPQHLLLEALQDAHPAIREHAVRLSEKHLASGRLSPELERALLHLLDDQEPRVRYQLAFSLGEWTSPKSAAALSKLAIQDATEPDITTAVLSSATRFPEEILLSVMKARPENTAFDRIVQHLVQLVAARNDSAALERTLSKMAEGDAVHTAGWKLVALSAIVATGEKQGQVALDPDRFQSYFDAAREMLGKQSAPVEHRRAAVRLLGRHPDQLAEDTRALARLLQPQTPLSLQQTVLERLSELEYPTVSRLLIQSWRTSGPQGKNAILAILLRRESWTQTLLEKVQEGSLSVGDLGASVRQELLSHKSPKIRERANQLFRPVPSDRDTLVQEMVSAVSPLAGQVERGRELFEVHCANCHRAGQAGQGNGPNLAMLQDGSAAQLITAVLDPNRAVEDKYRNYTVELKNGEEISGILLNETGNSVTMMSLSGSEQTIVRSDIVALRSGSRSMMPEGFEQFLNAQDLADLIAFIRASTAPPKSFPGNHPDLVMPDQDGNLRLTANTAEIYGDTLVYESVFQNLGFWSSQNDRAVWTVELQADSRWEVWLDFACHNGTAGNKFILESGEQKIVAEVPETGTWEDYRQRKVGVIHLNAGRHRITFKPDAGMKGFLIDLREIRLVPEGKGDSAFVLKVQ